MALNTSRGAIALLCAVALLAPAAAQAAPASAPTAAAFERATDRLLDRPSFAGRASGGGGGTGVTETADAVSFPDDLYVTLYGAPQLPNTELGRRSPKAAARQVKRRVAEFEDEGVETVVGGFDLIGVVANSTPGPDRKYRTRQPDEIISAYLEAIRTVDGRLMLDIQPGRSSADNEVKALAQWIAEPDVDVGIDPEWNVGRRGIPGKTIGTISAGEINAASERMDRIVRRDDLPPKVLIVHQFTRSMIKGRRAIEQRDNVQVVLNFDGIGSPPAKVAGYESLTMEDLFNGFSIFLRLDTKVMSPSAILDLVPAVNFLLYQ